MIGFGTDLLENCRQVSEGYEFDCPHCGGRHCLVSSNTVPVIGLKAEIGSRQVTGLGPLLFYRCPSPHGLYAYADRVMKIGAIEGRFVVGVTPDVSSDLPAAPVCEACYQQLFPSRRPMRVKPEFGTCRVCGNAVVTDIFVLARLLEERRAK